MPIANDKGFIYRVYDPEGGGHYVNWRARSHWTRRHNAQAAADKINERLRWGKYRPAVVKKYELVEVY